MPSYTPLNRAKVEMFQRGTNTPVPLTSSQSSRIAYQSKQIAAVELPSEQSAQLMPAFERYQGPRTNLCMFNIIVAFDWTPNYHDLRVLQDATRSASDLLYDVTDGYMAIGAVCVGGQELMACADIQIFASNRLFPRSMVDGLNNVSKYQPIRLGRGIWHKNNRIAIPWDAELGVGTLVHEWGHYALGLKDQYLETQGNGADRVVIPVRNPVKNTVMAGLDKTELLSCRPRDDNQDPRERCNEPDSEWSALRAHPQFDWLEIPNNYENREDEPDEQPMPAFHLIGSAVGASTRPAHPTLRGDQIVCGELRIDHEHCWVYLVKGNIRNPDKLVAQGAIERAGAPYNPVLEYPALRLLGAEPRKTVDEPGDTVVVIGAHQGDPLKPLVLYGEIDRIEGETAIVKAWQDATPEQFPVVNIAVETVRPVKDQPPHPMRHKVTVTSADPGTWDLFIAPLGEKKPVHNDTAADVTSMDGHVLLIKDDGKLQLTIVTYSLGGSPDSGFTAHPNPIPAGSADGNAMIFFYNGDDDAAARGMGSENAASQLAASATPVHDGSQAAKRSTSRLRSGLNYRQSRVQEQVRRLSDENRDLFVQQRALGGDDFDPPLDAYRVVTTTSYQATNDWPAGWEPRSYMFTITSNLTLKPLVGLSPTLVLYYDNQSIYTEEERKRLVIARRVLGSPQRWTPISILPELPDDTGTASAPPEHLKGIVAVRLEKAAPGLFQSPPVAEHVRLFLMPT